MTVEELRAGGRVTVTVPVAATGSRPATVVAQGYLAAVDSPVDRPPKELKAFAKTVVTTGAAATLTLTLDATSFRRWDLDAGTWTIDPGPYDLVVAASARDERSRVRIVVTGV